MIKKIQDPSIKEAATKLQDKVFIDPRLLSRFKALNDDSLKISISTLHKIKSVFNISKIRLLLDEPEDEKGYQQIRTNGDMLVRGISFAITKTSTSKRRIIDSKSDSHYSDEIEVDIFINPDAFTNLFQDESRNIDYKKLNNPKYFVSIFNKLLQKGLKHEGLAFNTVDFLDQKYRVELIASLLIFSTIAVGSIIILSRHEIEGVVYYLNALISSFLAKTIYSKTSSHIKKDETYTFPYGISPDLIVRTIMIMLEDLKIVYFKES